MGATVVAAVIGVPIFFYETIDDLNAAVVHEKTG